MEIVGLIDWQNAHVTLLFNQVTHPTFFRQQGTETRKASRHLPETFEELGYGAKKHTKNPPVNQTQYKYYDLYSTSLKVPACRVLKYQETL
jgi:hypothetical protein